MAFQAGSAEAKRAFRELLFFRVGIVGGPASGKTTLFQSIAGHIHKTQSRVFNSIPLHPLQITDPFDQLVAGGQVDTPIDVSPEARKTLQLKLFWVQLIREFYLHHLYGVFAEHDIYKGLSLALIDITVLNVLAWSCELTVRDYIAYASEQKQFLNPTLPSYPLLVHFIEQLIELTNEPKLEDAEMQMRVVEFLLQEYDLVLFLPVIDELSLEEFSDGRRLDTLEDRRQISERVWTIHQLIPSVSHVVTVDQGRSPEGITSEIARLIVERIEAKLLGAGRIVDP